MEPTNLTAEGYKLLRTLRNGPQRHFDPIAGGELNDFGLAEYVGLSLSITDSGMEVPRHTRKA